jgi:hypothetical protein
MIFLEWPLESEEVSCKVLIPRPELIMKSKTKIKMYGRRALPEPLIRKLTIHFVMNSS